MTAPTSSFPTFSPGALPSRTAHVLETIKAGILNGYFKPGATLVENELAGQFGVSKTPVREALKTLESSGLGGGSTFCFSLPLV